MGNFNLRLSDKLGLKYGRELALLSFYIYYDIIPLRRQPGTSSPCKSGMPCWPQPHDQGKCPPMADGWLWPARLRGNYPKPALEALDAHIQGREIRYVFEGRNHCHISTSQIHRLLDEAAEMANLQEMRSGR